MNTYDEAHALAKAIRECDEMKRLTQAAEKIKSNADAGKMVKEYIMAQMKSDYAKLAGQKTDEQEYRHLQELALLISNNSPGILTGIYSMEPGGCGYSEDHF